jgi:hypothetical protein
MIKWGIVGLIGQIFGSQNAFNEEIRIVFEQVVVANSVDDKGQTNRCIQQSQGRQRITDTSPGYVAFKKLANLNFLCLEEGVRVSKS